MKLVMKIYCTKPSPCNRELNSCIWGGCICEYAKCVKVDEEEGDE